MRIPTTVYGIVYELLVAAVASDFSLFIYFTVHKLTSNNAIDGLVTSVYLFCLLCADPGAPVEWEYWWGRNYREGNLALFMI